MDHGHTRSELRNLALHRLAFKKLRTDPEHGKQKMLDLLERWLKMPNLKRQDPLLLKWRGALQLTLDELEAMVLGEGGQQLRQSSPMGVLLRA